jgi:hypothetical protein
MNEKIRNLIIERASLLKSIGRRIGDVSQEEIEQFADEVMERYGAGLDLNYLDFINEFDSIFFDCGSFVSIKKENNGNQMLSNIFLRTEECSEIYNKFSNLIYIFTSSLYFAAYDFKKNDYPIIWRDNFSEIEERYDNFNALLEFVFQDEL